MNVANVLSQVANNCCLALLIIVPHMKTNYKLLVSMYFVSLSLLIFELLYVGVAEF